MSFRLVIVEDIPLYREYLTQFCLQNLHYDVVAACSNVADARVVIGQQHPDLVLLDVCLGEEHGFDLVGWVVEEFPTVRCALMSAHCTCAMALRASKAPICGFIDKNYADMKLFYIALECIANGGTYYSDSYQEILSSLRRNQRGYEKVLTNREQEVLSLIGRGNSDEEMSRRLGLALATIQTHRRNIMGKLGINNAPKLIRYAIDSGLTQFTELTAKKQFIGMTLF